MTLSLYGYPMVGNLLACTIFFVTMLLPAVTHIAYRYLKPMGEEYEIYSEGRWPDTIGCLLGIFSFGGILLPLYAEENSIPEALLYIATVVGFLSGFGWIRLFRIFYILYWIRRIKNGPAGDYDV